MTVRGLLLRVGRFFRAGRSDRDLREQITSHVEEAAEEYVRGGMSPADARLAAMRDFGNVAAVEETYRNVRGRWLHDVTKDVRYGLRSLRRNPAFAVVAVSSLAVGIGANTAIFSIVNFLLLRPRPVADPASLVKLYVGDRRNPYETSSYPSYVDIRDRNEVLTGLAAYAIRHFKLTDADHVEQVWGETVSANYFDVLGVQPVVGMAFTADQDRGPGSNPAVVISHGLWQRRFNADPAVIGRTISINRQPLTIVAVAPPQYTGMFRGFASEVWIPVTMMPLLEPTRGVSILTSRGNRWLVLVGRLEPGTTLVQARAHFDQITRAMQAAHPDEWMSRRHWPGAVRELSVSVLRERDTRVHPSMQAIAYAAVALVAAVVNVVLAMACMNLASMLLARAVVRRKEVVIRLALGASRWRLVRQLMTESLLLALIAGAAGVVLTVWLLQLLLAFMPPLPEGIRLALDIRLDWRVLAYAVAFSTLTGVLFGLVPALQSTKPDVSTALKDESSSASGAYRKSRGRRALIVIQVACSLLLLIGAALVLRSLDNVRPTRLGFSSENVLVVPLTVDEPQYDRRRSQAFYREVSERVSALPGVRAVSLVQDTPGGFMGSSRRGTEIEGYQPAAGESLEIDATFVGPRYFSNMKVPVVQGRDFTEHDREGAPCVAIVNEVFVRRYLAKADSPLGKHLAKFESATKKQMCEIVGVVRDNEWQSLRETVRPFHALAVLQAHRTRMSLLVHTDGDPANQTIAVGRIVQQLDRNMAITDIQTVRDHFSTLALPFRLLGVVMGACGTIALLLATIGVYGIVSYSTAQRTREIGIRMALGAAELDILKMIVGHGMALVAVGLLLGLGLSAVSTRVLTSAVFQTELLFGVSPTDARIFAGVTMLLAVVAAAACCVPALRAARVDPVDALRCE